MNICYFGDFDPAYSRNRVLIKGLEHNGIKIIECNSRDGGLKKYLNLIRKYRLISNQYDLILVGYSDSRWIVLLAKILAKKPLIWDAFYSLYDARVFDRQLVGPNSLKAKYYYFLDWLACRLADKILLDTNEHIEYFVKTFKVNKDKFIKVLVGTAIEDYKTSVVKKEDSKYFLADFHGKYIPLQGVKYIIRAAEILKNNHDIKFNLIGGGQTYSRDRKLADDLKLNNINFIDWSPLEKIAILMSQADVCLGIFGDTLKTQRIIPNKVYEAIAMRKPVISADTPATKELFEDGKNILLCRAADPEDLAQKILELKNNSVLREKIAQGGYNLYKQFATPEVIGKNLLHELTKINY